MKRIVLSDKIYNIPPKYKEKELYNRYIKYINEYITGFPKTIIKIRKLRNFDKRFEIIINGPEDIFVFNLLKKEIGTITEFNDVKIGDIFKGNLIDVGKHGFGLFVDCGILKPKVDVLINLNILREQLCEGKKRSLREIIKAYNFIDHFPLEVEIEDIDLEKQNLQGKLSSDFLKFYNKILAEKLDGVFLSGGTKNQFKKALVRTGHLRDIVSIERYGFLEHIVILKDNTEAPGIIAHIGKYLKKCKLSAIRYKKIEGLLKEEK